jgi:hypothetical protein
MSDETRDPLEILRSYATPPAGYVSKLPKGKEDKEKRRTCSTCGGYHDPSMFHLDYVGHADVTRILLEADPRWNWEPLAATDQGLPLFERDGRGNAVGLWIRLTVGDMTRLGYGSCEAGKAEAEKELIGDALRNAAMRFGVALDLWSKSDAGDGGGRDTAPDRSAPDPRVQAQHDELLAELETLLDNAADIGAEGDPAKAREYAARSVAHARKAIESVREAVRVKLAADDEEPPAPTGETDPQPAPDDREVADAPDAVKPAAEPDGPVSGDGHASPETEPTADRATCTHDGAVDRIGIARTRCRACGATFGAHGPDGSGVADAAPADAAPADADDTWRTVAKELDVAPAAVLNALRKGWPSNSQWNKPNRLTDVDRLAAKAEHADQIGDLIGDLARERESA